MNAKPYHDMPGFESSSDTSQEAAVSMIPQAGKLQRLILKELNGNRSTATCDTLEIVLGLSHQTASARIRELYLKGFIEKIGKAKTRSGRNAVLWGITNEGKELLK